MAAGSNPNKKSESFSKLTADIKTLMQAKFKFDKF